MWSPNKMAWTQSFKAAGLPKLIYEVNDLEPNHFYTILINGKKLTRIKAGIDGSIKFDFKTSTNSNEIIVLNK